MYLSKNNPFVLFVVFVCKMSDAIFNRYHERKENMNQLVDELTEKQQNIDNEEKEENSLSVRWNTIPLL